MRWGMSTSNCWQVKLIMVVLLWCSVELHVVLHRNPMEIQKFSRAVLNAVFCYLIFDHLTSFCSEPVETYIELSFSLGVLYRNPGLAPRITPHVAWELRVLRNKGNAVLFPIRRIPWEAQAAPEHNSGTLGVLLVPVLMFSSQFSP